MKKKSLKYYIKKSLIYISLSGILNKNIWKMRKFRQFFDKIWVDAPCKHMKNLSMLLTQIVCIVMRWQVRRWQDQSWAKLIRCILLTLFLERGGERRRERERARNDALYWRGDQKGRSSRNVDAISYKRRKHGRRIWYRRIKRSYYAGSE